MRRFHSIALPMLLGLSACASYGGYAYHGREWAPGEHPRSPQPYQGELGGPGLDILDEWLRETEEGRAVVSLGWREARHGHVSEDTAHRANIWFRRYADSNRDMTITDPEIRAALVAAATPHLRRP